MACSLKGEGASLLESTLKRRERREKYTWGSEGWERFEGREKERERERGGGQNERPRQRQREIKSEVCGVQKK